MFNPKITAFVPKKTNHIWTGWGEVTDVSLKLGIVSLTMTSGRMKGELGGFNLDKVKFKIEYPETKTESYAPYPGKNTDVPITLPRR